MLHWTPSPHYVNGTCSHPHHMLSTFTATPSLHLNTTKWNCSQPPLTTTHLMRHLPDRVHPPLTASTIYMYSTVNAQSPPDLSSQLNSTCITTGTCSIDSITTYAHAHKHAPTIDITHSTVTSIWNMSTPSPHEQSTGTCTSRPHLASRAERAHAHSHPTLRLACGQPDSVITQLKSGTLTTL